MPNQDHLDLLMMNIPEKPCPSPSLCPTKITWICWLWTYQRNLYLKRFFFATDVIGLALYWINSIKRQKHLGEAFFTTQGSRFLRLGHRAGQPTFPIPVVSSIRLPAGFGYSYPLPRNSWSHKLFAWFLTSHSQECLSGRCAGLAFPSYNNEGYFGMGQDTLLKHLANSPNHSVPSPNE